MCKGGGGHWCVEVKKVTDTGKKFPLNLLVRLDTLLIRVEVLRFQEKSTDMWTPETWS